MAATPQNGSQITLEDEAGNEATFIFDHNSSATDGSTRIVQGEELVVVGIDGVEGNQAGIADRLADTINNTEDLLIDASSNGNDVNIGTPDGKAVVDVEANVQVTDNFETIATPVSALALRQLMTPKSASPTRVTRRPLYSMMTSHHPQTQPFIRCSRELVNDFGESAMDSEARFRSNVDQCPRRVNLHPDRPR